MTLRIKHVLTAVIHTRTHARTHTRTCFYTSAQVHYAESEMRGFDTALDKEAARTKNNRR